MPGSQALNLQHESGKPLKFLTTRGLKGSANAALSSGYEFVLYVGDLPI